MSSGISALCRACPRLASRHARQAAARSVVSHPKPQPTARTNLNPISSIRWYATERNKSFRNAFSNPEPKRREKELHGAFVSSWRNYPSEEMTNLSEKERNKEAHKLAGAHGIWAKSLHANHFLVSRLDWTDTFHTLKTITPRSLKDDNRVSAVRVVLSEKLIESESLGRGVSFINTVTGIVEKLRVDADAGAQTPNEVKRRSFILRGGRRALSHAVDELSKAHEGVEVFKLGDVATTDYHTQMLWPTKEVLSEEELQSYNRSSRDRIWLHEEVEARWTTRKISSIPKPEPGDPKAFETYITDVIRTKIKPDLVVPLYFNQQGGYGKGWNNVDVGAERVQIIMEAFENLQYRSSITSTSLKRALSQLSRVDGHRGKAKKLFRLAEELGLPMDTETYNIMLEGIAATGDYRDFHKWITRMKACEFEPNARTWLIFLRLVKKDDARHQIVTAMFERNLLVHESVRRGVAAAMASTDAYQAFKSGASLKQFIREHNDRFGYLWYSSSALFAILKEYFRYFHGRNISASDWTFLVEQKFEDGVRLDTEMMNPIIEMCADNSDWVGVIWCVNFMQNRGIEFDDRTIRLLMGLAQNTGNHYALTATLFHGVHHRAINYFAKQFLKFALLGKVEGNPWRSIRLPLFTASMANAMRTRNAFSRDHLADQISEVYKQASGESKLVPAEPLAMSLMSALSLHHKAAGLRGAEPEDLPALEIPMKRIGESDDDVQETFKFDSTVALVQDTAVPEPEKTEEATSTDPTQERSEDQETDSELEDIAEAAQDDTTIPKKRAKKAPAFNPEFSLFTKMNPNNTIPKRSARTSESTVPAPRVLSREEKTMLKKIRETSPPRPGDETLRFARDVKEEARHRKVSVKMGNQKPWLYDDFYTKTEAQQQEDTAEWLFKRYREIKARDKRNVDFASRQMLMIRAQQELEEARKAGISVEELLGHKEEEKQVEEEEWDEEDDFVVEDEDEDKPDPRKWG